MTLPGRLRCLGLLLLAAWLTTATPVPAAEVAAAGTVTWIYDADTVEVAPHGKVRLLGIDAPERQASPRDQEFIALGISRNRLRHIYDAGLAWSIRNVKGQQVLLSGNSPQRDRHGRLLAYLHLADGRLLNRLLLEQGLAIVYRRFEFVRKDEFLAAEAGAKSRRIGLWAP